MLAATGARAARTLAARAARAAPLEAEEAEEDPVEAAFAPDEGMAVEEDDGSRDLVPSGLRVYRRELHKQGEHQRVFRWGVGNRFRMLPENRFTPVHKPHPRETMVRDEYYESPNPNVRWE